MSTTTATDPALDPASDPHWPGSWRLELGQALQVHVPDRLGSLTTYVLLEQERWFEQEFGFVQRLVDPDSCVLDIGANHGVYTLALAHRLRGGRVIAFEPTCEPRLRLMRSILDNGLADRVAVAPLGLSDSARDVEFVVGDNSELNTRHGEGSRRETVRLERLDDFVARHLQDRPVRFVKLDAEGEEPAVLRGGETFFRTQSPVVMFELLHGGRVATELPALFEALGYAIWRHLPGLDLLAPFDLARPGQEAPLNLFAIKPDRAAELAQRGLLADPDAAGTAVSAPGAAELAAARAFLSTCACFAGAATPGEADDARDLIASVHADPSLAPTDRLARVRTALGRLEAELATRRDVDPALASATVHALHLLGRRHAAVALAQQVLDHWPRDAAPATPFLPPLAADLHRTRSGDAGAWLRLVLAEFVERGRAFSSYFAPSDPMALRRLLRHPDHAVEIERRYALGEFRQNRVPDTALLPRLRAGTDIGNPSIWRAVLDEADAARAH